MSSSSSTPARAAARGTTRLIAYGAVVLSGAVLVNAQSSGRFVPSADGQTVHDTLLKVTWLADANLPATQKFGLSIRDSGAMDFAVAKRWVAALNARAYLGRTNWTMPATPETDSGCSSRGPQSNSFGLGCAASAMGSLYYRGLGIRQPNTAVPIPPGRVGPFKNFQPYLYWSSSGKPVSQPSAGRRNAPRLPRENGEPTFSFNTGWRGGNVSNHVMYVLPLIAGRLPGTSSAPGTELQPSADGQTVYDPVANVTWLANANLAAEMTFGVSGIVADGAMTRVTADAFIDAMNKYNRTGYLGQSRWQLPPADSDPTCSLKDFGYNCTGSPLGVLYYGHLMKMLGLRPGEPVVRTPDIAIGPFHNIQPYLYWSCAGGASPTVCSGNPAAPGFQWSFSFGNGFEGTDVVSNSLYVMVYSPDGHAAGSVR